jgi:hypothetical protein
MALTLGVILSGCAGGANTYLIRVNQFGNTTSSAIDNFSAGLKIADEANNARHAAAITNRAVTKNKFEITPNPNTTITPEARTAVTTLTSSLSFYTRTLGNIKKFSDSTDEALLGLADAAASLEDAAKKTALSTELGVSTATIEEAVENGKSFREFYLANKMSKSIPQKIMFFQPTFASTIDILRSANESIKTKTDAYYAEIITERTAALKYYEKNKASYAEIRSELSKVVELEEARKDARIAFNKSSTSLEKLKAQHLVLTKQSTRRCRDGEDELKSSSLVPAPVKLAKDPGSGPDTDPRPVPGRSNKSMNCDKNIGLITLIKAEVEQTRDFFDAVTRKLEKANQ